MKFTISKNRIVNVLAKIQGIAGRKSNLAITECVLIKALENTIKIFATDLETGFEGEYQADVESSGVIAINARKFYEILKEFPSEVVEVNEVDNRWIEIGNHNVQFHIVGMNSDDFPDTPFLEDIQFVDIESQSLRKMIERTAFIMGASDDKRAHVNGVCAEFLTTDNHPILRFASTDGSRLSCSDYELTLDKLPPSSDSVLIPKKGLHEVAKFLSSEEAVQFGLANSYLMIKSTAETTIIRLLEGDFPKYEAILVKDSHTVVKMEKAPFAKMLRRMSILASENYKAAIFKFQEDQLLITATNPDIGESKEDMSIEYSGEVVEAAFNPRFFIDTLNVIAEDDILLYILSDNKPCIVEGTVDRSFLSVIMPMRI